MSEQQKQMNPLRMSPSSLSRKDEWNENVGCLFDDEMREMNFEVMCAEWKKCPPCDRCVEDPFITETFIYMPLNRIDASDYLKELLVEKKKAGEHIIGVAYTKFPFIHLQMNPDAFQMTYGTDFMLVEGEECGCGCEKCSECE